MEAASSFVTSNIRIVFLPIVAYLVSIAFFTYWAITAVYMYGIGTVKYNSMAPFATVENSKHTTYLAWYFLFGLLWVVAFFICLQQFIIASMTCMWYFKQGSDDETGASVMLAAKWGCWNNCGSVSFGAFCIAVVTMIRIVFEYLAHQYEKMAPQGTLYKVVKCCITCVLYCLDQYVKFITKNAFIQIALHNQNFCPAAVASFFLIVRQAGRFGSAAIIGWIIMMLGKGTIMGVSGYITVLIIKSQYPEVEQPFIPAGFVVMVAYVVGSLFLSIFSFSSTAILHCFIVSEDNNMDHVMPECLKSFVDASDEHNAKKGDAEKPAAEGTEMAKVEGNDKADEKANNVS
jgi:hypothetical protein